MRRLWLADADPSVWSVMPYTFINGCKLNVDRDTASIGYIGRGR